MKKGTLRKFTKFRGKHQCQGLFFNKVAGLRLATLLKKKLWHRCFPLNFATLLRTPFLENNFGRLPLMRMPSLKVHLALQTWYHSHAWYQLISPSLSIILRTCNYLTNKWHPLFQRCKTTVIWKTDTNVYIYL